MPQALHMTISEIYCQAVILKKKHTRFNQLSVGINYLYRLVISQNENFIIICRARALCFFL